jgi:glycosyltransferase involved in cell wall biosynthesis
MNCDFGILSFVRQNTAVVDEYVEAADAGLYTSEFESFGLSILETMFYGKPVVAFGVGGIPEVIGNSVRCIRSRCSPAAAGLDTLVESRDLARELGERSRSRAFEQFSADRILPQYEALYRRVIAGCGLTRDAYGPSRQSLLRSRTLLFAIGNRKSKNLS